LNLLCGGLGFQKQSIAVRRKEPIPYDISAFDGRAASPQTCNAPVGTDGLKPVLDFCTCLAIDGCLAS
jgi:hypothetical protein